MEVILLQHMENLGSVGETVRVKDGYARNYLLPRRLACLATEKNRNFYRSRIEAEQRKLAREKESADKLAEQLQALTLTFKRKSKDEEARLFGSVTSADIGAALEEKGYELDRKRITLPEPIKRLGEYQVSIKLHPEVTVDVPVVVEAEEETAG